MKDLFYKPVKLKSEPEDFLFWGCLHNGHRCERWDNPLWKTRGFSSVEEHDEQNIIRWNERATDQTIGFLLGDTCFGMDAEKNMLALFEALKFDTLYLQAGNHFAGFHQIFNSHSSNEIYLFGKTIIFVPNYFETIINGQPIVNSHYPLISWNGQARGSWALFSHVHGNLSKSQLGSDYLNSGAKCYEVSVERNKFPVSFEELDQRFKDKPNIIFDHHGPDTNNPF